jgi:hypothetical protein
MDSATVIPDQCEVLPTDYLIAPLVLSRIIGQDVQPAEAGLSEGVTMSHER